MAAFVVRLLRSESEQFDTVIDHARVYGRSNAWLSDLLNGKQSVTKATLELVAKRHFGGSEKALSERAHAENRAASESEQVPERRTRLAQDEDARGWIKALLLTHGFDEVISSGIAFTLEHSGAETQEDIARSALARARAYEAERKGKKVGERILGGEKVGERKL